MRIALVHPFLWPNVRRGGERYLDDLAWYLGGAGHAVEIITGAQRGPAPHGARVHHVRYPRSERFAARGVTSVEVFGAAALPQLLRRYDVVHAFTPAAALAARAAGRRTLYTLLGHPLPGIVGYGMRRRLVTAAMRRSNIVAALSAASAQQSEAMFGRTTEVLSPGVRLEQFEPRQTPRTGPPSILFPAAALPQKGLASLLSAMQRILSVHSDARLIIGGPGDPSWAFDGLGSARASIEHAVDVIGAGSPQEVAERYRNATVTVLPSRDDAFGLVLVESLACGTPAVCCRAGGMPEVLDDPDVGRVAPVDDPHALANAILDTIALAANSATGGRCHQHARRWDWTTVIGPAHEAIYERLARESRSAGFG